jgi:hypothetical protein
MSLRLFSRMLNILIERDFESREPRMQSLWTIFILTAMLWRFFVTPVTPIKMGN